MTLPRHRCREVLEGGGLYVLTGVDLARGCGHREIVAAALEGGADMVQLRDQNPEHHEGGEEGKHATHLQ